MVSLLPLLMPTSRLCAGSNAFSGRPARSRQADSRACGLSLRVCHLATMRVKVLQAGPARLADVASAPSAVPALTLSTPERRSVPAEASARPGPTDCGLSSVALPQGSGAGTGTRTGGPAPSAPWRPLPERAALLTGARAGGCRGRPAAGRSRPRPLRRRAGLAPPSCSGAWAVGRS